MTDITELALIKGQKVEAPYYLAECTECGKMYSSSKLIESRNYFDGDADCYCPHCNAEDADIADLGSGEQPAVMAWNYQQARIDTLVEALEKSEKTSEARREAIDRAHNMFVRERDRANAAEEALEKAQSANEYLREQSAEWERKAISNFEDCAEMSARIEELESQRKLAFAASNRWADKFREAERRIAGLESQLKAAENNEIDARCHIAELESRTVTAPQSDYFASLVALARVSADKAMKKFPQPNYVLLKVAEEAGEVVQAGVHYAENRMVWKQVEGEIVQLLAMLIRLVTEGDQINGVTPPASCAAGIKVEAE